MTTKATAARFMLNKPRDAAGWRISPESDSSPTIRLEAGMPRNLPVLYQRNSPAVEAPTPPLADQQAMIVGIAAEQAQVAESRKPIDRYDRKALATMASTSRAKG